MWHRSGEQARERLPVPIEDGAEAQRRHGEDEVKPCPEKVKVELKLN